MPVKIGRGYRPAATLPTGDPLDLLEWSWGWDPPDPITFMIAQHFLDRGYLFPRQVTFLKIMFLRDDLFTQYDLDVIAEWIESFKGTGNNGIQPDIFERIRICKARGYRWFREVLAVLGRRGGKGHVGALALAYILWCYMGTGDPQGHYGVDRSKKLQALIYAGKREQAKANLWRDVVNVIIEAPCYSKFISQSQAERLSVFAPHDFKRMREMGLRGIMSELDPATFEILPKESTLMSGRGGASFALGFDEMAHVVASGANRSAEEVYKAATPSLDQFGRDGFIYCPSSPWQMMGQFYEDYLLALKVDERTGAPAFPTYLMLQLASWDIYLDWERAQYLPVFPACYDPGKQEHAPDCEHSGGDRVYQYGEFCTPTYFRPMKGPVQEYDEQMEEQERANPETFAVERRSHFATALDAYLNTLKVQRMFEPWEGRPLAYGPPELVMQTMGSPVIVYKCHGDPSLSNANFGFAIAHGEQVVEQREVDGKLVNVPVLHCVFDLITHWSPMDFPDNVVDYDHIEEAMWSYVLNFLPGEMTFDQWNSASTIQRLQKRTRDQQRLLKGKNVQIFEKTATSEYNWSRCETFKTALNMGWVHAPYYEQADLELRFLQLKNANGRPKVDKPDMGPVQTKDVADCLMECVMTIIGEQVNNFLHEGLSMSPRGAVMGGSDPFPGMRENDDPISQMSGFGRSRGMRREMMQAQQPRTPRRRF